MELKELIAKRDELEAQLKQVNDEIRNTPDGYFYFEYESCYGAHPTREHINADSASRSQNRYYGDNGFSHIITNNPAYTECDYGQSITIVDCTREEAKRIFDILKYGEYEDYVAAIKPVTVAEFDY